MSRVKAKTKIRPHCSICCPGVVHPNPVLSVPAQRRESKKKRRRRTLCYPGESLGCCRYKSENPAVTRRYCELSTRSCLAASTPRGHISQRRPRFGQSSTQESCTCSRISWRNPYYYRAPIGPLQAPHDVRRMPVIIDITDTESDDCLVEDAIEPDPEHFISEQPIGEAGNSEERLPTHSNHPDAAPLRFPVVNASRQGQDSPPLTQEPIEDPQQGIPSDPLDSHQVLPRE